jgi:hypothetical protein
MLRLDGRIGSNGGNRPAQVHDEAVTVAIVRGGEKALGADRAGEIQHHAQLSARTARHAHFLHHPGGRRLLGGRREVCARDVEHHTVRILEHQQTVLGSAR